MDPALDGRLPLRIVLTGGGGFLGRAICEAWIALGVAPHDLIVASRTRHPLIDVLGVFHIPASVTDPSSLLAAFDGADLVYHLAGLVSRDPVDAALLHDVHVVGTTNVLATAKEAGVGRVVYASSMGTFGCTDDPSRIPHEDGPDARELVAQWPYYATKIEAERIAMAAHEAGGVEVMILNPSLLLGPGDVDGSSTGDVADFLAGRMPVVARGGVNIVDVRDAAQAFVAASDAGRPGVRHLLGAANLTIAELLGHLSTITGKRAPRLSPPARVQVGLARFADRCARLVGRRAAVGPETAAMAQLHWYADGTRAASSLSFAPRAIEETLADTVSDIRSRG